MGSKKLHVSYTHEDLLLIVGFGLIFSFSFFFRKKQDLVYSYMCMYNFLQHVEFLNVLLILHVLPTFFVWTILVFSFHLREILNVFIPGHIGSISSWSCLNKITIYRFDPVALEYFLKCVYLLQPVKKTPTKQNFFCS